MTEQEQFWAGEFGDAYNERNQGEKLHWSRIAMFSKILSRAPGVGSILELGCNSGGNLEALSLLLPGVELFGVEVNKRAAEQASKWASVVCGSLLTTHMPEVDMSLACGVLIHIAPDDLPMAYGQLYHSSRRYVLLIEYYNPTPVEIEYRGHAGRLWKRDFAGEMLDRYQLRVLDYSFVWRRDVFPQDDVTWFLMEKI